MNDIDRQHITGGRPWQAKRGREYLSRATGFEGRTVNKFVADGTFPGTILGRTILLTEGEFADWWERPQIRRHSSTPTSLIRHIDPSAPRTGTR